MPTVKSASKFMDRQGAAVLALFILGGLVLFTALPFIAEPLWQKALGIVWFVGLSAALFWLLRKASRDFMCPDCGGAVGPALPTDEKPGTPLLRHCKQCDVLWRVGAEPD
jgi:hypothetical protein